jgi:hypothetical protein
LQYGWGGSLTRLCKAENCGFGKRGGGRRVLTGRKKGAMAKAVRGKCLARLPSVPQYQGFAEPGLITSGKNCIFVRYRRSQIGNGFQVEPHTRPDATIGYASQYGHFVREMQNCVFHFSFRQVRIHSLRPCMWRRVQAVLHYAPPSCQRFPPNHAEAVFGIRRKAFARVCRCRGVSPDNRNLKQQKSSMVLGDI